MCNLYTLRTGMVAIADRMGEILATPLLFPPGVTAATSNMEIPEMVYPRREGLVLRPVDPLVPFAGLAPVIMHWNLTPFFHKGSLKAWRASTNNCRSETMESSPAFRGAYRRRRCLIPASALMEWTGPRGSKTRHTISRADGHLMFLAGLWDRCEVEGEARESYTMVMMDTAPGQDIHPFHNRQPILLGADQARTWLDLSVNGRDCLAAPAAGTLIADPAAPVAAIA